MLKSFLALGISVGIAATALAVQPAAAVVTPVESIALATVSALPLQKAASRGGDRFIMRGSRGGFHGSSGNMGRGPNAGFARGPSAAFARSPNAGFARGPGEGLAGGGDYRPRYSGNFGLGLGAGLLAGGLGYPYYDGSSPYYDTGDSYYTGAVVPAGGDSVDSCMQQFKSYDPRSGTYLGYDGLRHPCP